MKHHTIKSANPLRDAWIGSGAAVAAALPMGAAVAF